MSSIWRSIRPLTLCPKTSFFTNWRGMDLMGGMFDRWRTGYKIILREWWSMAQCSNWDQWWMVSYWVLWLIFFNIFINNEIKCTLCKVVGDTKQRDAVDTAEGWDATATPRQAWTVSPGEPHKVHQSQVQDLAPGLWQLPLPIQTGRWKQAQPCQKWFGSTSSSLFKLFNCLQSLYCLAAS